MFRPRIRLVGNANITSLVMRLFHTSMKLEEINKALLSKLRKKTGFPFIKCKTALQKFENNFEEAEKWLKEQAQKEGWAKATKLQGRPMSQGLIGLIVDKDRSVMVEVNCETDFVARNAKFQSLVSTVTNACLAWGKERSENKIVLGSSAVKQIPASDDKTLADILALEIGNIGENMDIRRAVLFKADGDNKIGSYVHVAGGQQPKEARCGMGRFGALAVFSHQVEAQEGSLSSIDLGRQICQHIVGMNPTSIGTAKDLEEESSDSERSDSESSEDSDKAGEEKSKEKEEENIMLKQEFLLDSTIKVHEFLSDNSATVHDFARFQCGEELEHEQQPDQVNTSHPEEGS